MNRVFVKSYKDRKHGITRTYTLGKESFELYFEKGLLCLTQDNDYGKVVMESNLKTYNDLQAFIEIIEYQKELPNPNTFIHFVYSAYNKNTKVFRLTSKALIHTEYDTGASWPDGELIANIHLWHYVLDEIASLKYGKEKAGLANFPADEIILGLLDKNHAVENFTSIMNKPRL